ncbi:MAG: ankyrin repeat domain-containing protein [Planctomycetota bacterium]
MAVLGMLLLLVARASWLGFVNPAIVAGILLVICLSTWQERREYALWIAIVKGDAIEVEALISKGYDVRSYCDLGTPLTAALRYGYKRGRYFHRSTSLSDKQAEEKVLRVIEVLIDNGALVNDRGSSPRCPIHMAVEQGRPVIVKLLLERGADPNIKDASGMTPLQIATNLGQEDTAKLLLQYGAEQ